jgi:hypothetical protein
MRASRRAYFSIGSRRRRNDVLGLVAGATVSTVMAA